MWTERWKLKKNAALNLLSPKTPAPAFRARESFTRAALTHTRFSPELALRREPPLPALSRNHRGGNGHSASTPSFFVSHPPCRAPPPPLPPRLPAGPPSPGPLPPGTPTRTTRPTDHRTRAGGAQERQHRDTKTQSERERETERTETKTVCRGLRRRDDTVPCHISPCVQRSRMHTHDHNTHTRSQYSHTITHAHTRSQYSHTITHTYVSLVFCSE